MRGKLALVAVVALSAALCADTVYLKNGQTYTNCKARFRRDGTVEVKMEGGTIVLPREKVAYIEYEEVVEERVETERQPVLSPVLQRILDGRRAAEQAQVREGQEKSRLQVRVEALISLLATGNEEDRRVAKEGLLQLGQPAVPFLVQNLHHEDGFVRNGVSEVLGGLAPRNAVKPILEALYSVSPDNADLPHNLKVYANNLRDALRNATGQDFGYRPNTIRQIEAMKKWVEWYDQNKLELPPQVGEPELDPKAEDYKSKLEEARALVLKKRGYAAALQPEGEGEELAGGEREEAK